MRHSRHTPRSRRQAYASGPAATICNFRWRCRRVRWSTGRRPRVRSRSGRRLASGARWRRSVRPAAASATRRGRGGRCTPARRRRARSTRPPRGRRWPQRHAAPSAGRPGWTPPALASARRSLQPCADRAAVARQRTPGNTAPGVTRWQCVEPRGVPATTRRRRRSPYSPRTPAAKVGDRPGAGSRGRRRCTAGDARRAEPAARTPRPTVARGPTAAGCHTPARRRRRSHYPPAVRRASPPARARHVPRGGATAPRSRRTHQRRRTLCGRTRRSPRLPPRRRRRRTPGRPSLVTAHRSVKKWPFGPRRTTSCLPLSAPAGVSEALFVGRTSLVVRCQLERSTSSTTPAATVSSRLRTRTRTSSSTWRTSAARTSRRDRSWNSRSNRPLRAPARRTSLACNWRTVFASRQRRATPPVVVFLTTTRTESPWLVGERRFLITHTETYQLGSCP